jgi:hypothetical protein
VRQVEFLGLEQLPEQAEPLALWARRILGVLLVPESLWVLGSLPEQAKGQVVMEPPGMLALRFRRESYWRVARWEPVN